MPIYGSFVCNGAQDSSCAPLGGLSAAGEHIGGVLYGFLKLFGSKGLGEIAVHAGLECGILREKFPEMLAVSFGPIIRGAHSPDEGVKIDSVGRFWELLKATLAVVSKTGLQLIRRLRPDKLGLV